jgi:hypothetical protein
MSRVTELVEAWWHSRARLKTEIAATESTMAKVRAFTDERERAEQLLAAIEQCDTMNASCQPTE